ncbi:MAG: GNAT family N-acetyltransferase, partial [Pyrinomonadaceae bacterium]
MEFFTPLQSAAPEIIVAAPPTVYQIRPLTDKHLKEVLYLNQRCFKKGENYTRYTFSFLLSEPRTLSYRIASPTENMVAFIFVMIGEDGTGHITTVGVAPEHRRRGLAQKLLVHVEEALIKRGIKTIFLEVRVDNLPAQMLYRNFGYSIVQR